MAQTLPGNSFILKQSTTFNRVFFYGTVSQTVTVNLSKNNGAFAAAGGTVSEVGGAGNGNGWYNVALTTTDTNTVGILAYHATAGAGGPTDFSDIVQSQIFSDLSLSSGRANISSNMKQNANSSGFTFIMTSSTTHQPQTGLVVTAQKSLAGIGFTLCDNTVAEVSNGMYKIDLTNNDLNATIVMLRFTASGADDLSIQVVTQP